MSVLQKLTEGIISRDLQKEGAALLNKWEKTGLLEGIDRDHHRQSMSVLLENQAKELLRESSSMASGDVEGFAAVAFPIVRRVFGGLIANDLVSVQPMSLPSGLIFFLDFTFSNDVPGRLGQEGKGSITGSNSIYGGDRVASEITGGLNIQTVYSEQGFYNLNQGYASPTGSGLIGLKTALGHSEVKVFASGIFGGVPTDLHTTTYGSPTATGDITPEEFVRLCRYDPDFTSGTTNVHIIKVLASALTGNSPGGQALNTDNLVGITVSGSTGQGRFASGYQVRRLTQFSGSSKDWLLLFFASSGSEIAHAISGAVSPKAQTGYQISWPQTDAFTTSNAAGSVIGTTDWGLEGEAEIPEIDIKVDSVAITAITKKLKAKWTPELGQDLNAYHNLDAEVELTSILSEQIALEIDREILNDLVRGSTAGTKYWSRSPGLFLDRDTGLEVGASSKAPDFTGTVSEWYETLLETVNDVSAQIHRKTLRGGANFLVCGPETANILEFTSGFRASVTADVDKGTAGVLKTGQISKKWDIYVDPYFPRNVILVGRKGSSFLESGYVYAPYVPLQVTPTIFGVEDFVPRKGVMTRYGKKMVRPDFYGLVIVRGMIGEAGG